MSRMNLFSSLFANKKILNIHYQNGQYAVIMQSGIKQYAKLYSNRISLYIGLILHGYSGKEIECLLQEDKLRESITKRKRFGGLIK